MKKIFSKLAALFMSGVMVLGGAGIMPVFSEEILEAGIECEALYAEWQGSGSYTAYYKPDGGEYTKVDDALIRNDGSGGYRVEVLGLKGGEHYTVKVVPVVDGNENEAAAFTFEGTPESYDRSGYAHFQTTDNPGAYLWDGTLPANANVIYVNDSNKNTVKLGSKQGLANILSEYNKGTTPLVIRFIGRVTAPDGINSDKKLTFKGNAGITIEGVGTDSGLYGWGFGTSAIDSKLNTPCADIEFRNLHFDWNYDDAVEIQNANRAWVHDNTFTVGNQNPPTEADKDHGDGSCDAKRSDYVTISYNHFKGTAKTCLLGASKSSREDKGHYSYHHNFFDEVEQRGPRTRWHDVHVYNNYYKNVGYDLDDGSKIGYGIAATCEACVFAENNYFENTYRPLLTSDKKCTALSANEGGVIKEFGNYFDEKCFGMEAKDYFPATDKYQVLTAQDYTCSYGGHTYDNFDTSDMFYKDDYFLETAEECIETVLKYAGTESKTSLTLTNAINGSETGTGDNTQTSTETSTVTESTEITTADGTEVSTQYAESTETTSEVIPSTTVEEGKLSDDFGYYFYDRSSSTTPLTFGTIFNADKTMNISTLTRAITIEDNGKSKAYPFDGVAGFGNNSAITFTVSKGGVFRLVATSGSTTARKMDITDASGKAVAQILSGKSSEPMIENVNLDAGTYTLTNNGGGEAKLFYIGFSYFKDEDTKPDYGNADLSEDGITANDSAIVLQYALNSASVRVDDNFVERCNVDGEDGITANDSAIILQKALVSTYIMPVER